MAVKLNSATKYALLARKNYETLRRIELENNQRLKKSSFTVFIVIVIMVSLISGGLIGYSISNLSMSGDINYLQNQVSALQDQMSNLQSARNASNAENQSDTYIVGDNASLAPLYAEVKDSIVVIRGLTVQYDIFRRQYYSSVQGRPPHRYGYRRS